MQHRDTGRPDLEDLVEKRWSRREFLKKTAFTAGALPWVGSLGCAGARPGPGPLQAGAALKRERPFSMVSGAITDQLALPQGYEAQVLLAWGDPILKGATTFKPGAQRAAHQLGQFGYNADFIGYIPLAEGPEGGKHGLLCTNHEYATGAMMFPGFADHKDARNRVDENQCAVEMAAVGHSVVEIRKEGNQWKVVQGPYNRRLTLIWGDYALGHGAYMRRKCELLF